MNDRLIRKQTKRNPFLFASKADERESTNTMAKRTKRWTGGEKKADSLLAFDPSFRPLHDGIERSRQEEDSILIFFLLADPLFFSTSASAPHFDCKFLLFSGQVIPLIG